jgi:hypothetical protein
MLKPVLSFTAAIALAAPAFADVITPVGVEATSTFPFFGEYSKEDLISGSGLSGGLHDSNYANMWMTDQSVQQAQLTFDLGGLYNLTGADIWQFNFGTNTPVISTLDRGVKDFRILTSTNGVDFTQVFAGTLARSVDGSPIAAQSFAIGGVAQFVQIDILNNYAQGTIYENDYASGLSEVRFNGAAVPEPATWAMMIGGFGLVGGAMRRRPARRAVLA